MRLNKDQKAFSAVDPESVGFNRLQFKSPKMKTGLLCDRAEIKELFNSSSKVSERDECGGRYTVQTRNERRLRICILSHNWCKPDGNIPDMSARLWTLNCSLT